MADARERERFDELAAGLPDPALGQRIRIGLAVMVALAVLTVIEYVIAVKVEHPLLPLLPFAALKFLLILEYFMHITAVLGKGGHH